MGPELSVGQRDLFLIQSLPHSVGLIYYNGNKETLKLIFKFPDLNNSNRSRWAVTVIYLGERLTTQMILTSAQKFHITKISI